MNTAHAKILAATAAPFDAQHKRLERAHDKAAAADNSPECDQLEKEMANVTKAKLRAIAALRGNAEAEQKAAEARARAQLEASASIVVDRASLLIATGEDIEKLLDQTVLCFARAQDLIREIGANGNTVLPGGCDPGSISTMIGIYLADRATSLGLPVMRGQRHTIPPSIAEPLKSWATTCVAVCRKALAEPPARKL
jgi:hypothetical protein